MQVFTDEGGCLKAERGRFSLASTWVSLMILICNVKGLGAKKALKAMVRPVKDIAKAIELYAMNL